MGRTPELADHVARTDPVVGFCAEARAAEYLPAAGDRPVFRVDEADATFDWLPDAEFGAWPEPAPLDRAAVMFTRLPTPASSATLLAVASESVTAPTSNSSTSVTVML